MKRIWAMIGFAALATTSRAGLILYCSRINRTPTEIAAVSVADDAFIPGASHRPANARAPPTLA